MVGLLGEMVVCPVNAQAALVELVDGLVAGLVVGLAVGPVAGLVVSPVVGQVFGHVAGQRGRSGQERLDVVDMWRTHPW